MNRFLVLCCALLAALAVHARPLAVGDAMPALSLPDQHGKQHTLQPGTVAVVLSTEMPHSKLLNQYLEKRGRDVFAERHIVYVSDISPMPAPITKMFALPKMQKYKHTMWLNRADDFAKQFPVRPGRLLIMKLGLDLKVTELVYVATTAELEQALGLDAR
jgi:hypothetical protein